MSKSDLIKTQHLVRKAIIYIRQSSPHQVLTNQESLHLQYALKQRAQELGWHQEDIEIIDTDLGLSASAAVHRTGFKEVLAKVTLGQVGIILSYDVPRLSRNCSDFYPLLDICAYKNCLIADCDGIYDPATANGRLLLGLKGQISEMELYTIRARLTAGIVNKAKRGDLALKLPVGFLRDDFSVVHKEPNLEVQSNIDLIFSTFLQLKSASKVMMFFHRQNLSIARLDRFGDLIWKKPSAAAITSMLKNPAYAGAFVYGRSKLIRKSLSPSDISQKRLPMQEWKIIVKDKYPSYIDWETFEKIQLMLKDNYAEYNRSKTRGAPRAGEALLQGIVYCGECSHKMTIQYKKYSRYLCTHLKSQYGAPVCQSILTKRVDTYVVQAFFQAISPIELDIYSQAISTQKDNDSKINLAYAQELERLRYQAALAQRQFNKVDPDNRLVASELERRWEESLRILKTAEEKIATQQKQTNVVRFTLTAELKEAFSAIGQKLPEIWDKDILSNQNKKALLRALIDKVIIHRVTSDTVETRIVWKGGLTTTLLVPLTVGSFNALSEADEMEKLIFQLNSEDRSDEEIAKYLTQRGYRSPMHSHLLPSTVKIVRLKHKLFQKPAQAHPRIISGYLTVTQIAQALNVTRHWIYYLISKGAIIITKDSKTGLFLFPDSTSTFEMFHALKNGSLNILRFS